MKPIERHFADWESHVFGFGYGTGEQHTLAALKGFMSAVGRKDAPHAYNYECLESALGPQVAWLLINILCHSQIIEYGTSPRFGWLTQEGEALKAFLEDKTIDDLEKICGSEDHDYCTPMYCNCQQGPCSSPFWIARRG